MKKFLLKFIKQKNINLNTNLKFENLKKKYEIKKIFNIFSNDLNNCQIRFIGGCVRKALSNENVDDIDLAVDLTPEEVKIVLKNNNIKFFETGIEHGTITAKINNEKFEITSLRRDIKSYGRHADVEFTKKWYEDAARRDFSINCIYADLEGNLYDPFEGKKDLKNGKIKFIGNAENRIREDYLRVLRYMRFFLDYSSLPHDLDIQKKILKNISGINKISKERLLSELEKIFRSKNIFKINDDEFLKKILNLVFPELKNIHLLEKLNDQALEILQSKDFLFWLSILIIDETDNTEYFLYKYKLSNNDKKRIKFIYQNYPNLSDNNFFSEKNFYKLVYYNDKSLVIDLIDFKICVSKKDITKMIKLKNSIIETNKPIFPIKAKNLIKEYNLKEGKELGTKLKKIEDMWVQNNFKITNQEVNRIINN
ncbi:CCA tRNA nucleotidyltransferase [Candidatus Pelagibacter sp.]|nr:CCA tRNA nucleotidyltransferase [Candidatus Pelagibacter sp.]MDA9709096.1 CCA tRNA nucleotidyltransferase [Candidatus Pelagibacter sp.]